MPNLSTLQAFLATALAVACGSLIDAVVKGTAQSINLHDILAWRFLIGGCIALTLLLWPRKDAHGQRIRRAIPSKNAFLFHICRGMLQLVCAFLFFYGLRKMDLALATILGFTAALMVPLMAWPALKERPNLGISAASLVGFVGIVIAVSGQFQSETQVFTLDLTPQLIGTFSILGAALGYGAMLIMLRMRAGKEDALTISAFTNVVPAVLLLPVTFGAMGSIDILQHLPIFMLLGILGYGTWFLMSIGYANAPAQQLVPLEYTSLIWAATIGYFAFGETPAWRTWIGGAIVIAACFAVAIQTRYISRRTTKLPTSDILE